MATLTVSGPDGDETVELGAALVVIGRGLESDVRLKDVKASRRHVQVARAGGGYRVKDLGSGNGTFLNGVQLAGEQPLAPGDRIQVGDTVITFEDEQASPGAAGPAAGGRGGESRSRSETRRMANTNPPTGRTGSTHRPTTARKVAGAPTSASKTVPSKAAPTGQTSKVQKTGTQAVRTGTGRTPTARTTTSTRREQLTASSGKKGMNPVVVGGIVVGVVVVVFTVILFLPSGEDKSIELRDRANKLLAEGAGHYKKDQLDEAVAKYKELLKLSEQHKELKKFGKEAQAQLDEIASYRKDFDAANKRWEDWRAEVEKEGVTGDRKKALLLEGRKLKSDYGKATLAWLSDLEKKLEVLQREVDTDAAIADREKFQGFRNQMVSKYTLDKKDQAKYGPALVEWKQWCERASGEEKRRGEAELESLEGRAAEAFKTAQNRAERANTEEGKAKAREILEEAFVRLKGSKMEPQLKDLMKKFD